LLTYFHLTQPTGWAWSTGHGLPEENEEETTKIYKSSNLNNQTNAPKPVKMPLVLI
jgi:hypothetical protein